MAIFIFGALNEYKNILTSKISRFRVPYFLIVEPLHVFCLLQYYKNAGGNLFGSCAKVDMLVFFVLELHIEQAVIYHIRRILCDKLLPALYGRFKTYIIVKKACILVIDFASILVIHC